MHTNCYAMTEKIESLSPREKWLNATEWSLCEGIISGYDFLIPAEGQNACGEPYRGRQTRLVAPWVADEVAAAPHRLFSGHDAPLMPVSIAMVVWSADHHELCGVTLRAFPGSSDCGHPVSHVVALTLTLKLSIWQQAI